MNQDDFQNYFDRLVKIRFIKAPIMNIFRIARVLVFQFLKDKKRLRSLRNQFSGQRCFIVGNGPSLCIDDLERIKDEYCFAFNRIFDVYDKTEWRPYFYMVLDNDVMKSSVKDNIHKLDSTVILLNIMAKARGITRDDRTYFFCSYGLYRAREYNFQKKSMSNDISRYISLNYSVICAAIETAIYLGFREIIIIGADNCFSHWIDRKGNVHFSNINDYKLTKPHNYNYFCYQDSVNSCFDFYRNYADYHGIKILNATRGGKLEAFERVDFDEYISRKVIH